MFRSGKCKNTWIVVDAVQNDNIHHYIMEFVAIPNCCHPGSREYGLWLTHPIFTHNRQCDIPSRTYEKLFLGDLQENIPKVALNCNVDSLRAYQSFFFFFIVASLPLDMSRYL